MKYFPTVASNLVFIVLLLLIFVNAEDTATSKSLAAVVMVYLAVINRSNALTRQIGHSTIGALGTAITLHKKAHPMSGDHELSEAEEALKNTVDQLVVNDYKFLIHAACSACVALVMLVILLS